MEPFSLTASAIATLLFQKALEKTGETLGQAVIEKSNELLILIRKELQDNGTEKILTEVQEAPTEETYLRLRAELAVRMYEDSAFASRITNLMRQLEVAGVIFNEKNPVGLKLRHEIQCDTDVITQLEWSPDKQLLTSTSNDGTILIWDMVLGKSYKKLEGHSQAIRTIAWSPDGRMLASGSSDSSIKLWDTTTGNHIQTIAGHSDDVNTLAWSPDGQILASGSSDSTIKLWTIEGVLLGTLNGFHPFVYKLAWSPDGQILASCSDMKHIWLWDTKTRSIRRMLEGHSDSVYSVAWSPNGKTLASASKDGTILLWDTLTGQQKRILQGHTEDVNHVSFSADGRFLASKSFDKTVRLWHCDTGIAVVILEELVSGPPYPSALSFHLKEPVLATLGGEATIIRIWELNFDALLSLSEPFKKAVKQEILTNNIQVGQDIKIGNINQVVVHNIQIGDSITIGDINQVIYNDIHYINAKVILVGESGIGKTGLAVRITEKEYRPSPSSTHGAQFWQIPVPKEALSNGDLIEVKAELTLWDLAGQPDYHLVHQLFLDDTDVALLLFDCSDVAEPFRGVPYWAKVLKKLAPPNALKYLVSSRCDVSPVTVDRREINRVLGEYSLDGYFRTCAKTGEGVEELLQQVLDNIPWNNLPRTTTPKLFQVIREFLLERKEAGDTLIPLDQLSREAHQLWCGRTPNQAEIDTVVGLLQARGFVYRLAPTPNLPFILLRPELINKYASSIIQAARHHPAGIGTILEREVVCANLSFDGFEPGERLPPSEEKLVLESTVELFIRHTLAFREMGRLVFPSQLNILHRIPIDEHPPTEVTYEFSGSVEAIYASLVVCLTYTQDFQRENLWKYAAEFSREGHQLGFAMQQVAEGTGELEIYFYPGVSDFDRVTFIRFIKNHLYTKGIDLQERIRLYCPNPGCGKEVTNREAIESRVKAGKLEIPCQYCDTAVLIPRSIEEKYSSDRAYLEKQKELQATVEKRTQQEVKAFRQDHQQYMADSDNCIRILHLSDIHLGTVEQANRYFSQLATDLTQNLHIKQLNYLVISGDIANRSTEEEYDAAFYLVDKLVKRYGLDPSRVVIVPGNHDLNWDLSEAAYPFVAKRKLPNLLPKGRYIEAGGAGALICDEAQYKQRFAYFSDRFYKKVYGKPYPLEYDQQGILHPCPQDKILFLALNSCWEIDHHYRDRAGIHPNAIANAVDQILSENYDDWLKIAVWHHPVNGSESLKNPAFLEQLAVHGFQLGIHGHIHEAKDENFQYDTKRGLRIIAAGTFGAPTHEQVTGIPLQYNLLTLDPETGKLTVETRKKEKADGAWSADARWGDKNNPIPRYPIQLRYGSEKKKTDSAANSPQAVTEGNSSNPQQSILSNVKVGGSMTVGSINQYYGFGTAPQPAQPTQTPPPKRTILFLASSPINEARQRLDVEMREIDNGLRLAQQRDRFVIEQRWAVRTDDLRRALLDLNPEIVHFCGHGAGAGGLVLEDNAGHAKLASTEALARLFKLFTNRVRCVVLNACYSEVQADAIRQHIDYVVGMSDAVSDAAAIKFAVGFYDALVRERSYEDAFDFGCNAIEFENLPEELTPVLKKKQS